MSEGDLARLAPMSAFGLRNRYLSRLGAQVCAHTHTHTSLLMINHSLNRNQFIKSFRF